jgi:hypothetical protein
MSIAKLFNISIYLFFGISSVLMGVMFSNYIFEIVKKESSISCHMVDVQER